jgi:hypothetical protein
VQQRVCAPSPPLPWAQKDSQGRVVQQTAASPSGQPFPRPKSHQPPQGWAAAAGLNGSAGGAQHPQQEGPGAAAAAAA